MRKTNTIVSVVCFSATIAVASLGCGKKAGEDSTRDKGPDTAKPVEPAKPEAVKLPDAPPLPDLPVGLPPTPEPENNKATAEKVALGELLFFDKRLSDSSATGCEICHMGDKGWADGLALSKKYDGSMNTRHSPTLVNVGYYREWYWDGRKATLEDQILAAWTGQVGGTPDKVAAKLAEIPAYKEHFQRAFGAPPSKENIPQALAAFVRIKLRSGGSPWDRFQAGEKDAVSQDAIAGYDIFVQKAQCAACHTPPLYTDLGYHNVGIGYKDNDKPDVGRFQETKLEANTGAFKTPTLRDTVASAPYFHDGSVATLEEAVDFMLKGGYSKGNKHLDPLLKPVKLKKEERDRLIAFIKSLTPDQNYTRPTLP